MKKIAVILTSLALLFALCSCGGSSDNSETLTFATGGEAGTYYAYGNVLAQYVSNNTDLSVTAVAGNGSQANVEDLDSGAVQLAFCQSDVMSYAFNGTNLFSEPVKSFSQAASLYMEQVQIVTTKPDIKTVADLKGKIVSVGATGSGTYFNALDILGAYDLSESDITSVHQSFGDSAESLKDGKIDAAFIVAGAPTNAITELSTGKNVYLVGLDDAHIKNLTTLCPYYSKYTITKDVYKMDSDTDTVAVAAVIIVRNDLPEDTVYSLVKTIFDGKENIKHGKAEDLEIGFATSVKGVPFHKGAARYYEEKGISVETK